MILSMFCFSIYLISSAQEFRKNRFRKWLKLKKGLEVKAVCANTFLLVCKAHVQGTCFSRTNKKIRLGYSACMSFLDLCMMGENRRMRFRQPLAIRDDPQRRSSIALVDNKKSLQNFPPCKIRFFLFTSPF